MARRVTVTDPGAVRAIIAEAVLGSEEVSDLLGTVRLHPHQRDAVVRIRAAIRSYGGALLADAVGLGKTFVALAVAREYEPVAVVAPAVLRPAWRDAAGRAGIPISLTSMESLSRGAAMPQRGGLVIVDEAHHFRSVRTRRYAALARAAAHVPVLLLSATPVHNRPEDLVSLLALFLGEAACSLPNADVARCVIRREHHDLPHLRLPRLTRTQRIEIAGDPHLLRAIMALPPPLPPRDGTAATTLVTLALAHLWTSSDAAVIAAIRRRLAAGSAMRDAAAIGRVPSRQELAAWTADDAAVQLAFPALLVEPGTVVLADMLSTLDAHLAALRELLAAVRAHSGRDTLRVRALRAIRDRHPGARIVAFSSFAATVHALYTALAGDGRVAMVSGRGGRIASGRLPRAEVLRLFRTRGHAREATDLLLATDLLSEGIDLPEASVVVHLDLPWTAARLEQRLGRARRLGGTTAEVHSYTFVQPAAVEVPLRRELRIRHKARLAAQSVGALAIGARTRTQSSAPRAAEMARAELASWRRAPPHHLSPHVIHVASVRADDPGFIALLTDGGVATLVCGLIGVYPHGMPHVSADPAFVHRMIRSAGGAPMNTRVAMYRCARRAVAKWLSEQEAVATAALDRDTSTTCRAVLARLGSFAANAPPDQRADRARMVSRVRAALTRNLPHGLERQIAAAHHALADDGALATKLEALLAGTGSVARPQHGRAVTAVLLLDNDACRARPSPPDDS